MSQAAAAWAPGAVTAVSISFDPASGAALAWTPGTMAADYYNIYGVDGSSVVLMTTATTLSTTTMSAYSSYAVSGVKNNVESDLIYALLIPCVDGQLQPPPPGVRVGDCGTLIGRVVEV
jgi:hypothetical protein